MAIQEFTGNMSVISGLSDRPIETDGLTAAQLKAKFDQAPQELKEYLNAVVVAAVNALLTDKHNHTNKTLLDTVAAENVHSHSNKSVLDTIAAANVHTHGNKSLLDTYTQTNANLAEAVSNRHSHSNKSVLDTIAAANVHTHGNKSLLDSLGTTVAAARVALGITNGSLDVLWTNSSPTSEFAAQTLTISGLSSYTLFKIVSYWANDGGVMQMDEFYVPGDSGYYWITNTYQYNSWHTAYRNLVINRSAGTVEFGTPLYNGSYSNLYLIPRYILGMKI